MAFLWEEIGVILTAYNVLGAHPPRDPGPKMTGENVVASVVQHHLCVSPFGSWVCPVFSGIFPAQNVPSCIFKMVGFIRKITFFKKMNFEIPYVCMKKIFLMKIFPQRYILSGSMLIKMGVFLAKIFQL